MAGAIPPQNGGTGIENSGTLTITGGNIELNLPGDTSLDFPITLNKVYQGGDSEIDVIDVNPIIINTLGNPINSMITPSSGSSSNSQDRIEGFGFIAAVDMYITALQYRVSSFTGGGTRHVGLYKSSPSPVLWSDRFIANTDPVDSTGTWYTSVLADPVFVAAGEQWGISVVVPAGEAYNTNANAVPNADVNINQIWDGPDTSTLQYPNTIINASNEALSGGFQFKIYNSAAKISNDGNVLGIKKDGRDGDAVAQISSGVATLVAGTVTISTSSVLAGDFINLSCTAAGGVQGVVRYSINPGVSITLTSSSALDTSTYKWKNLGA